MNISKKLHHLITMIKLYIHKVKLHGKGVNICTACGDNYIRLELGDYHCPKCRADQEKPNDDTAWKDYFKNGNRSNQAK